MAAPPRSLFYVGERVAVGRHRATVRYVGPAPGGGGGDAWVGLEWDELERGKHDGEVKGVRLFRCVSPGARASLVRSTRLEKEAVRGEWVGDAVRERYGEGKGNAAATEKEEEEEEGTRGGETSLVLVAGRRDAERRSSRLWALRSVSVAGTRAFLDSPQPLEALSRVAGPEGSSTGREPLEALLPAVEDLDLSGTFVGGERFRVASSNVALTMWRRTGWDVVVAALSALPKLRTLDLGRTRGVCELKEGSAETGEANPILPGSFATASDANMPGSSVAASDVSLLSPSLNAFEHAAPCSSSILPPVSRPRAVSGFGSPFPGESVLATLQTLSLTNAGASSRFLFSSRFAATVPELEELRAGWNGISQLGEGAPDEEAAGAGKRAGDADEEERGSEERDSRASKGEEVTARSATRALGGEEKGAAGSEGVLVRSNVPPSPPLPSRDRLFLRGLPALSFPRLRLLDLEGNPLTSWTDVRSALGQLPSLETLLLGDTRIAIVQPLECSRSPVTVSSSASVDESPSAETPRDPSAPSAPSTAPVPFPSLATLSLRGCPVSSWASIDALAQLPALRALRVSGCPLPAPDPESARAEVLARLGAIETLNGGAVAPDERRDAELWWTRGIVAGWGETREIQAETSADKTRGNGREGAPGTPGKPDTSQSPILSPPSSSSSSFPVPILPPPSTCAPDLQSVLRSHSTLESLSPQARARLAALTAQYPQAAADARSAASAQAPAASAAPIRLALLVAARPPRDASTTSTTLLSRAVPGTFTLGRARALAKRALSLPAARRAGARAGERREAWLRADGGAGLECVQGVPDDTPLRALGANDAAELFFVPVGGVGETTGQSRDARVQEHEDMLRRLHAADVKLLGQTRG